MYIHMYVYVYVYIYIWLLYIRQYIWTYIYIYVYMAVIKVCSVFLKACGMILSLWARGPFPYKKLVRLSQRVPLLQQLLGCTTARRLRLAKKLSDCNGHVQDMSPKLRRRSTHLQILPPEI